MSATEKGFLCLLCGSSVVHEASMRRHLSTIHLHCDRRYRCPICHKTYKNRNSFGNHVSTYHKEARGLDLDRCVCW